MVQHVLGNGLEALKSEAVQRCVADTAHADSADSAAQQSGTKHRLSSPKAALALGLLFGQTRAPMSGHIWLPQTSFQASRIASILAIADAVAQLHRNRPSCPLPRMADVFDCLVKAEKIESYIGETSTASRSTLSRDAIAEIATVAALSGFLRLGDEAASAAVAKSWADGLRGLQAATCSPLTSSENSQALGQHAKKSAAMAHRITKIVLCAQKGQSMSILPSAEREITRDICAANALCHLGVDGRIEAEEPLLGTSSVILSKQLEATITCTSKQIMNELRRRGKELGDVDRIVVSAHHTRTIISCSPTEPPVSYQEREPDSSRKSLLQRMGMIIRASHSQTPLQRVNLNRVPSAAELLSLSLNADQSAVSPCIVSVCLQDGTAFKATIVIPPNEITVDRTAVRNSGRRKFQSIVEAASISPAARFRLIQLNEDDHQALLDVHVDEYVKLTGLVTGLVTARN